MGEVFRAKDSRLDRDVAIKVLPAAFAQDPDRLARFEREAKAIAALSHPNILSIHDTGTLDGHPFVVTELLEGETLGARLGAGGAPLPVRKAIDYAVQVARGLAAAHDKGLVHRDLKPDNIFLLEDGRVKILDFGLARSVAAEPAGSGASETVAALTDPGTVMGTVGYMAPEQVRGRTVDARSDLFALGTVLYEMVAGRPAFTRETAADTMSAILKEDAPELTGSRPDVSPGLDRIIRHCLEKNPTERFQSARDVAFALEALSGTASGTTIGGVASIDPGEHRTRPRVGFVVLAAVAASALLLGGAAGYVATTQFADTSSAIANVSYQPVTFDQGFVYAARFGQDGKTIVYSADWDGRPRDVFVTSVERPEVRALGLAGADLLSLSATGDLAVMSDSRLIDDYLREGTLSRTALAGGVPRPEVEHVRFADIAPDGAVALVRRSGTGFALEFPIGHALETNALANRFFSPRVSPSGREVAAFAGATDGAGLVLRGFARSGGVVFESPSFDNWWGLAWRSDSEVWFAAPAPGDSGDRVSLFSLNRSGAVRRLLQFPGAATLHDVSAHGDVLASIDQSRSSMEWLDPGADARPRELPVAGFSYAVDAADNRALLFSLWGGASGAGEAAYIWRPQETRPVRIAEGSPVALSRDGATALVSRLDNGVRQFWLVPTGVGQPRSIDVGAVESLNGAAWHPDGRLILDLKRPGATAAVFAFATTGGAPLLLLPEGFRLTGERAVSSDGTRLSARDANGSLASCVLATSDCQRVPGSTENDLVAGWHTDSRSLYVYQRYRVPADVALVHTETGRRTPFTVIRPLQPLLTHPTELVMLPDGTAAYSYFRSRSQLFVIRGLR